ncbi:MAG: 4Fe-4S dicluster domain-containing protein [Candidatus Woesearchaeota archaeon]|jgi:ferredoxin|nr:4Fe-4S dicluster domain-containing protein [Candidatus Woesearchaeota archaeon]
MYTQNKDGYILPKKDLNKLFKVLEKYGDIIAPKKDQNWLRFENVKDIKEVEFEGIFWYSAKKFVFPAKQVLFEYNGIKIMKPRINEKRVLFGLRLCDLNSFFVNDKLFLEQKPANENYKKLREHITLVGLWCDETQDKYCFCDSLNLKDYYDVCLFEKGSNYHIKTNSKKGEEILSKLKLKTEEYSKGLPRCENRLDSTNISELFEMNNIWRKGSDDCLSCGDCTTLCPTCLCFDVEDESNLDLKSGVRVAKWDSCMYKDFTGVAGGHIFRNERVDRFKHRFFHKLDYFPKKFGELMCTGCGRCIRGCPNKIDWIELVNEANQTRGENK